MAFEVRGLVFLAALCAAAGPTEAAVFRIVASDADSLTLIDPAATKFDSQTRLFSAWTVGVKRRLTDEESAQPGYVRTLNEYDCVQRQVRWRTVMVYSRFGQLVLQRDNSTPNWVSGYQGGGQDPNLRAVCDEATAGAISAPSLATLVIGMMASWDPPGPAAAATGPALIPAPPAIAKKR